MINQNADALRRIIEYAQREAQDLGLRDTTGLLEKAKESVEKAGQYQSGSVLDLSHASADDHGTGLQ